MVFGRPDLENEYRRVLSFLAQRSQTACIAHNLAENRDIIRGVIAFRADLGSGSDSLKRVYLNFLFYISMKKRYLNSNKGFA